MGKPPSAPGGQTGSPLGGLVFTTPTPGMCGLRVGLGTGELGGNPEPVLGVRGRPGGARKERQAGLDTVAFTCRTGICSLGLWPWS